MNQRYEVKIAKNDSRRDYVIIEQYEKEIPHCANIGSTHANAQTILLRTSGYSYF